MDTDTTALAVAGFNILAALIFYFCRRNAKHLLDELWAVDTYDAKELRRMCRGGFDATVKVAGEVSCDSPVTALASGIRCCWFRTVVEREVRRTRTVTETDSRGRRTSRTETYYEWETALDVTGTSVFKVTDDTGYTLVDPEGADIDTERVVSKVVRGREPWFGTTVPLSATGSYRITEHVFRSSGRAFVLGRASCRNDAAIIRKPDRGYLDPKRRYFIISRKSEKELTRSKHIYAAVCYWGLLISLAGAGIFLYMAFSPRL